MKSFDLQDRVTVSAAGGWKTASLGTVVSAPEPIETLKGPELYYWVRFDVPLQTIDGEDEYDRAQVLSCYLDHG